MRRRAEGNRTAQGMLKGRTSLCLGKNAGEEQRWKGRWQGEGGWRGKRVRDVRRLLVIGG